ncbi:MAG: hypothetical protein RIM72_16930 [Alphaproteobacteria bacterium]
MTLGFHGQLHPDDTENRGPTTGPADLWWRHVKRNPRLKRDNLMAARASERLNPSEFRNFVGALPQSIRDSLTGLDSFNVVLKDTQTWETEQLSCGVLFRQQDRKAKGLCIAFTGFAMRFGVAPVLFASIFPRPDYDFAFIFDPRRSSWRIGPDGREWRVDVFRELKQLAEGYDQVLSAGHSGGAIPALEFHCFYPRAHAIALSPAPIIPSRPKMNRSAANSSLAYDWICNCATFSKDTWPNRLIIASENSQKDRGYAINCGILANTRVRFLDGPAQHGIWRRRDTTLRMVKDDLDRFLRNVGL